MSFNQNSADNMWEFEDLVRRASQRLFDPTLSPARVARNRNYRIGILQLLGGVTNESPFDVAEGIERIVEVFPSLASPNLRLITGDAEKPTDE
jgi:hypothetical protein